MVKHKTKVLIFSAIFLWSSYISQGQECVELEFKASDVNRKINWQQFESISLPFTMIYGGPVFDQSKSIPLSYGFTHLSDYSAFSLVPKSQRALIYYGPAFPSKNQPWELFRSPWDNDMTIYNSKWESDFQNLLKEFPEKSGLLEADLMVFDIERQWRTNFDILQLKSNPALASRYSNLPNEEFLNLYKADLRKLYTRPITFFETKGIGKGAQLSAYSDSPIWNTFDNIQGNTWQKWTTDPSVLNYLCTENGALGGEFDQKLDFYSPSAYYYYDYPHPFAGEYLSYLLFQVEANKAWSKKPVIPFVWLRYSFTPAYQNSFIKPWMAEATAIFPFFAGADGLWLWENPFNFTNNENFATYEYFLKGLKRLEKVKRFFEGDFILVAQENPRDLNEKKTPVWRGVVKDNELLIAAHNPFASSENATTNLEINYKNFSTVVALKGYETKMCVFKLDQQYAFTVWPNPTSQTLNFRWLLDFSEDVNLTLIDLSGRERLEWTVTEPFLSMELTGIEAGVYVLKVNNKGGVYSEKVIVLP